MSLNQIAPFSQTRQWVLRNKPFELPSLDGDESTFQLVHTALPEISNEQLLVKPIYFSNDPAQRTWIAADADPDRSYAPPISVGEPIAAIGIAEVLESRVSRYPQGTLVYGRLTWSECVIMEQKDIYPIPLSTPGLSVTHFMGSLGLAGITAYCGLCDVVKATADDSIVVSGAAGAVGTMAVQIARKMIGCRKVIGIAGTDEKCRFAENLGATICLNYRSPSFEQDLIRETEGFVDVYFDNVGGRILDLMLKRLKAHGRVAACGATANYNNNREPSGLRNYIQVILMRLQILGFNVAEYMREGGRIMELLIQAWRDGQIVVSDETETIFESRFEDIPQTWLRLFDGANKGKMITKLV